jgi:nucleoside-diphosphate-sugar epimerase
VVNDVDHHNRQADKTQEIASAFELERCLSHPSNALTTVTNKLDGPLLILGAAGKMGPTLARMARRAFDAAGKPNRVIAVSRFSNPDAENKFSEFGVDTIRCDLLDRDAVANLPDASNIIYMAGQKFGTTDAPERTWAMNALVPAIVAERFPNSRIVAFSTGCVYPNVPVESGGSREEDALEPLGEYANSCVARERVFEYYAKQNGTPLALLRLNYAIDLRYGVLTDIALRVWNREPIDVTTGFVNVIWQGDACEIALRCLAHASVPPLILNMTGPETISVREMAGRFETIMGRQPAFIGSEAQTALLSNASKMVEMFGSPSVSLDQMVNWVAAWIMEGKPLLDKPTYYAVRDGRY